MRVITLLATLVGTAAIASTLSAAAAGPMERKACFKDCREARGTCLQVAKQRRAVAQASCSSDAGSRRACRRAAGALLRKAKPACGRFQRQCRACCRAGGSGPACPIGRPVAYEPPPVSDFRFLPRLSDGTRLLISTEGGRISLDPTRRSPLTAVGACVRWVTACVQPEVRSLDDCARSAPPCLGERPWEEASACCPARCFGEYEGARRAGGEAVDVFRTTYIREPRCVPGMAELLGR